MLEEEDEVFKEEDVAVVLLPLVLPLVRLLLSCVLHPRKHNVQLQE